MHILATNKNLIKILLGLQMYTSYTAQHRGSERISLDRDSYYLKQSQQNILPLATHITLFTYESWGEDSQYTILYTGILEQKNSYFKAKIAEN